MKFQGATRLAAVEQTRARRLGWSANRPWVGWRNGGLWALLESEAGAPLGLSPPSFDSDDMEADDWVCG